MIIASLNTKGGAGKSTTAQNLATAFSEVANFDTVLVDTDRQGSSLKWSLRRKQEKGEGGRLTVVHLPSVEDFKREIVALRDAHQVIVIDGAPEVTRMMTVAAAVADLVVVPLLPSIDDLDALPDVVAELKGVQKARKGKPIVRFLVNSHVEGTRVSKEIANALAAFDFGVLSNRLTTRMDYREAKRFGLGAVEYENPKAKREVIALLEEVMGVLALERAKVKKAPKAKHINA